MRRSPRPNYNLRSKCDNSYIVNFWNNDNWLQFQYKWPTVSAETLLRSLVTGFAPQTPLRDPTCSPGSLVKLSMLFLVRSSHGTVQQIRLWTTCRCKSSQALKNCGPPPKLLATLVQNVGYGAALLKHGLGSSSLTAVSSFESSVFIASCFR